jgi:hypothetical protein
VYLVVGVIAVATVFLFGHKPAPARSPDMGMR